MLGATIARFTHDRSLLFLETRYSSEVFRYLQPKREGGNNRCLQDPALHGICCAEGAHGASRVSRCGGPPGLPARDCHRTKGSRSIGEELAPPSSNISP